MIGFDHEKEEPAMRVALCLDDRNGLSFNHRRLSRDRAQQEDLLALCGGEPLHLAPVSTPLFDWAADRIAVSEVPPASGVWFAELQVPPAKAAEALILYRWNRTYPADSWFTWDLSAFTLTERAEFPGSSHDLITREIYTRKES